MRLLMRLCQYANKYAHDLDGLGPRRALMPTINVKGVTDATFTLAFLPKSERIVDSNRDLYA